MAAAPKASQTAFALAFCLAALVATRGDMALAGESADQLTSPAGVQTQTSQRDNRWAPKPEDCTVAPRTQEELRRLVAGADIPSATDEASATSLDGPPVGPWTWLGVGFTLWEWVACANAFSILQLLSLATDDFIVRTLAELEAEDTEFSRGWLDAILNDPWIISLGPLDPAEWQAVDTIQEVRQLPDGRVAADLVVILPGSRTLRSTHVLVLEEDRWLIDEIVTDETAIGVW